MSTPEAPAPVLTLSHLSVTYGVGAEAFRAVDDVSLTVPAGGAVGIVGETGCGKSTVAHAVLDLLGPAADIDGGILFRGTDLVGVGDRGMRRIRGEKIALVPQAAINGLNPVLRVQDQIAEVLRIRGGLGRSEIRTRVREVFDAVGLPASRLTAFPHELSGGMRQRVGIAMALVGRPDLVVADEPTTALDVVVQAQVLDTIRDLRRELGFALLLISHDLGVIADMCDTVVVMQNGGVVESGPVAQIFDEPRRRYTIALRDADLLSRPQDRPEPPAPAAVPVLELAGVRKEYRTKTGVLAQFVDREQNRLTALQDADLRVERGEIVAVVGESGSGKSTMASIAAGLLPATAGTVRIDGTPIGDLDRTALTARVQMVFQDPFRSLDPRQPVLDAVAEPLRAHGRKGRDGNRAAVVEALTAVGLTPPETYLHRLPHELSGGQRQRVVIARALVQRPDLVIADEPVSMLDVSVRAGVLEVLLRLREEWGVAIVLITHDLRVAEYLSDRVVVIRGGRILETGPTTQVMADPQHEYTRLLLNSVPGGHRVAR
ncbi:dipeptide ABC transporter ATP-binding protein [Nakamurella sp. YIM 132087]|uniref:Dipeptide ABC transporter ATP-binding protein n=1 Tax=Nakamurella alba TaxID=2665158 RepID=A0A7K1FQ53_9ACTN|nr:ABC transporter ATP-binding protein [Nakamurella alba]MTD16278.1 dipeptide ABC transporter ATP-binding protein [Nakamurella alba]